MLLCSIINNQNKQKQKIMTINPIMTLDSKRKALFPELYMTAEERTAANNRMLEKVRAEMSAKGLDATMVDNNQLGSSTDELWQVVAPEAIDAVSKKYFDLTNTTHRVEYGVPGNPKVCPAVMVEVVTDAGEAIVNATNWGDSALVNDYVPVTLSRYSRPFVLYNNDLMHGERIATKLAAAVESVLSMVVNAYLATAKAGTTNTLTVAADTFDPAFVAHNISALCGEYGGIDDVILSPTLFAKLVPTDALSLGTQPGTYGVGQIHSTAGLNLTPASGSAKTSTAGLQGLAVRKNGIAAAFGVPDLSNLQNGVAVRSLGTIAGIPMLLKSWIDPETEGIWNSVEAMAGFAVATADSIHLLQTAAADESTGTDESTGADESTGEEEE